jgi:hypothetical protein
VEGQRRGFGAVVADAAGCLGLETGHRHDVPVIFCLAMVRNELLDPKQRAARQLLVSQVARIADSDSSRMGLLEPVPPILLIRTVG